MANKRSRQRYRNWYARLLCLYPKLYRERFGEGMEQTFNDILRERARERQGLLGHAFWMFAETSTGIFKENLRSMIMQDTRRLIVWTVVGALMLLIPLAMQFTNEVQWNEAVAYGFILLAAGGTYELWQWLKTRTVAYRLAFVVGLAGALLIGWVNGAVGIIGSEDNPANLLYGVVFAVGLVGSLVSRFKPHGMACTLFTAAIVQILVPVAALIISPEVSWGNAGVVGVFIFNSFFAVLFVVSALLFLRAGTTGIGIPFRSPELPGQ